MPVRYPIWLALFTLDSAADISPGYGTLLTHGLPDNRES